MEKVNKKVGQSLADPIKYDNLFPGFHDSLKTQQYLLKEKKLLPADAAVKVIESIELFEFDELNSNKLQFKYFFKGSSEQYTKPS